MSLCHLAGSKDYIIGVVMIAFRYLFGIVVVLPMALVGYMVGMCYVPFLAGFDWAKKTFMDWNY